VERLYESEAYFNIGDKIDIDLDASPWGLGGILRINGKFESYFTDALTEEDLSKYGFARGDCKGQQTWECLAVLVALRLWFSHWEHKRVCLRIRSDSTTALQLLLTLRASGRGPVLIGKELALDLARGSYRPNVSQHLPGVANAGPDALSRLTQPGAGKIIPSYLAGVQQAHPPFRGPAYYLATLPSSP
jgi:hypothetical protein